MANNHNQTDWTSTSHKIIHNNDKKQHIKETKGIVPRKVSWMPSKNVMQNVNCNKLYEVMSSQQVLF